MPKSAYRPYVIVGVTAVAVAAFLAIRLTGPDPINVPGTVNSVAEGYEAILPLKSQIANNAQLTAAFVDLDRKGDQYDVATITFAFDSKRATDEGVRLITLDNTTHTAFFAAEFPETPAVPPGFDQSLGPLDASPIPLDVAEVLNVAKTNGLDDFCAIVPPHEQQVELRLMNSPQGPVWHVLADGELGAGPTATLMIVVDARTGAVISHSQQKGANTSDDGAADAHTR